MKTDYGYFIENSFDHAGQKWFRWDDFYDKKGKWQGQSLIAVAGLDDHSEIQSSEDRFKYINECSLCALGYTHSIACHDKQLKQNKTARRS